MQVEKTTNYGDEATFGGGKSIRDGMAQNPNVTRDDKNVADLVLTNALILIMTRLLKQISELKMVIF